MLRGIIRVNVVFQADPGHKSDTECKVEKAFVGYREDYEDRRKRKENYYKAMQVMAVLLQAVQKGHRQRGDLNLSASRNLDSKELNAYEVPSIQQLDFLTVDRALLATR